MKFAFLMQQHLAPRAIQANGFTASPVPVFRSILAGCKASVALTRVYLKPSITRIHNRYKEANTSVLVDDTSMQSVGSEYNEVLDKIVPAVVLFGEEAAKLKLPLSDKAGVAASSVKLACILQKELATYDMQFKVDQESRDVGVTHTAASAKPNKLVKSRFDEEKQGQ